MSVWKGVTLVDSVNGKVWRTSTLTSVTDSKDMTTPSPERIRQIRESLGENQIQFAKRLGVWHNTVSRWELGKKVPDEYPHVKMLMDLDEDLTAHGEALFRADNTEQEK